MNAVCTIIGHRDVYDADIQSRMQAAVDQLVAEHDAVEFLVYESEALLSVFLLAALKARTSYPQKVTISFVSLRDAVEKMDSRKQSYLYMSDKLVVPDIQMSPKDDAAIRRKKMLQWIVQKSTHIISYFYDMLYDPERQPVKHSKLPYVSLSTPETENAILEAALHMTEKEQLIFHKMNEGCTLKEAGGAAGVGTERARQILQHGCRIIRGELRRRYGIALGTRPNLRARSCGLFALGEATYDSLTIFNFTMSFLVSTYNISDIFVEQSYASSAFMFALARPRGPVSFMGFHEPHITALVGSENLPEDSNTMDAIKAALCPPCHAVGCVSRVDSSDFDVIADMIERTDFCICDLSAVPDAERIRKYAAQTKRTVLLDIGSFSDGNGMAHKQEGLQGNLSHR